MNIFFTGQTIGDAYDRKSNNFHLVRFVFALLVIYCHACVLFYEDYKGDILAQLTNNQIDVGAFAVHCFFIVSGFLICQSAMHSRSVLDYMLKRILRIFPAFFVSLVIVAFVIGPLVTSLSMSEYFKPDNTDPFKFVYKNIMLGTDGNVWGFKDLFASNPHPNSVNGSMWTLAHEFAMYLVLGLLILLGLLKRKWSLILLLGVFTTGLIAYHVFDFLFVNKPVVQWWVLNVWNYSKFLTEGFYFIAGSLMYAYKDKIPFNKNIFIGSVIALFLFFMFEKVTLGLFLFLPYIIIYLSLGQKYASFQSRGDYSYGLYIFSFPIQQTILFINRDWTLLQYIVLSIAFSLIAAFLSWHLIEKQALKLKSITFKKKSKFLPNEPVTT